MYDRGLATAYETTVLAEATSFHRRLARERGHLYAPEVLAAVEAGESVSGPDYLEAQRLRSRWAREWREAFARHRLVAVANPTVPAPAPRQTPSQSMFLGPSFNLTKGWNLNGFPAISVPVGVDPLGLPVGLQLAALPLEEPRLLSLAVALDESNRFFDRAPPLPEVAQ